MEEEEAPHLPLDIIYKIPEHISDPASLARAASSCKLWRGVIKDSSFLDDLKTRRLDHDFTSTLLLGFFYQDSTEAPEHLWQHHWDKNRCMAPRFIPTSELLPSTSRKEGTNSTIPLSLGTFIQGIGSDLNFYEVVASQDSFLVLCRHSNDTKGVPMRVCNPLTGEVFHLPDLPYTPPQNYALLVTDDISKKKKNGRMTQFFRLVAIWTKGKKLIYRYYCSKTRKWWRPASYPDLMAGLYLVVSSPAAAYHGAIHWLCGCWKSWALSHVVTLQVGKAELSYLELPSEVKRNKSPLLAKSADGGLLLLLMKGLHMSLWKHKGEPGNGTSSWVRFETIDMTSSLPMQLLNMHASANVKLEIFRGKSGVAVLWLEGAGLFMFSLGDRSMRKIHNEHVTKKYRFFPYEIDWLSCLAITSLVNDGSLSLDAEREKAQSRWRTLVSNTRKSILP